MNNIRNFCIIAHIDHGKSTLADRFLELTATVEKRKMHEQYLDQMDLERERGITIKLQPVRMRYKLKTQFEVYTLNLIDTPGHVDFAYEVSRSLVAVEGAVLLVDASKGIQAQTLANLNLAEKQSLKIIPVVNKIDLPNARVDQVKEELSHLLGIETENILEVSAKNGTNVDCVLTRIIEEVPSPKMLNTKYLLGEDSQAKPGISTASSDQFKALIFDSTFDQYKGVIAYVRVFSGKISKQTKALAYATKSGFDVLEVGYFSPQLVENNQLGEGEIGYIATGLKNPDQIKVGDTITESGKSSNFNPLPDYQEPRPMVFASFFPENSDDYYLLKDSLGKLKLTDASLTYEPESSAGLGRGFRLGFLGMLHVEIISERLKREFDLSLIISLPSVEYLVKMKNGEDLRIRSASALPDFSRIDYIAEPIVNLEIITPPKYIGNILELVSSFRNTYKATDYLGKETALLKYDMPFSEIITDFYDKLKSVSSGYASMSYEPKIMERGDLVRLDVLIAGDLVKPFSKIISRAKSFYEGRSIVIKLKEVIPPQWFDVAIQATIGGKVIARETVRARRKDVTGYLYGGDVTRKMKLLEKQKKGKKKMKQIGKVSLPQEVFLKMLKR